MKNNSLSTKLLMAAVTLALLIYFVFQTIQYFSDPLSTTLAYTYQVEESVSLSGYIIRDEQVLPAESEGLLQLQREEGERISVGGTVAVVYADQASLDRQAEIEALNSRIEQLQYVQETGLGVEAVKTLNTQIRQNILDYRSALAEKNLYDAEKQSVDLRTLVLKQDYAASDTEDLPSQIADLTAQRKNLQAQGAGSVRRITAPAAGLYSAITDGYETTLTPECLATLTPSTLTAIKPDTQVKSNVGKLVLGETWHYAAVMTTEDAKVLAKTADALEADGGSVTIQFAKDVGRNLPVRLVSIGPEENGRSVVIFQGTTHLSQLTLLRQQSAHVLFRTIEGIRIPKEALRIVTRTETDSKGTEQETYVSGVYCVVGMEAHFKPVEVLHSDDKFLLVAPNPPAGNETLRLRPGDEVIVTAKNLYHGKVIE